jgi:hypothetical protein
MHHIITTLWLCDFEVTRDVILENDVCHCRPECIYLSRDNSWHLGEPTPSIGYVKHDKDFESSVNTKATIPRIFTQPRAYAILARAVLPRRGIPSGSKHTNPSASPIPRPQPPTPFQTHLPGLVAAVRKSTLFSLHPRPPTTLFRPLSPRNFPPGH